MEYIRLRVWILFSVLVILVVVLMNWASDQSGPYKSDSPITDARITQNYPELYQAVYQREAGALRPFLTHQSDTVRAQAWRALAVTPVDTLAPYLQLAIQNPSEEAWFALSQHTLQPAQLRQLEALWKEQPDQRPGIARVLGRQGDRQSLEFLRSRLTTEQANSYHLALALSRLLMRYPVDESTQISIIRQAFEASADSVSRAYLYGWYRGAQSELTATARDTLFARWEIYGLGLRPGIDQYVNKILPARTTFRITNFYNSEDDLEGEVQLAFELATSLEELSLNDRHSLAAKILLLHPNPHVKIRTLGSITDKLSREDDLFNYITEEMVPDTTLNPGVWMAALQAAVHVDSSLAVDHQKRIQQYVEANPHLRRRALSVYRQSESSADYLQRLHRIAEQGDALATMQVLQGLHSFWNSLSQDARTPARVEQVRQIVFTALKMKDRGVAYTARPLLEEEKLFQKDDFQRINQLLTAFELPGDIEVFQQFGALYKARFEQQARPVIDSLAALNYAPLNRSLAEAGWDVSIPDRATPSFREPDWERLWELGAHPVWTLQTEKGAISIRMNTLQAPATISAIDSLSRAGAYEDIPFHRVVPNFVIQGGDIERKDGFGGPDFILPTEPSHRAFVRGAAGIASAGTDTEGSQYFIMHQWKPHLNGHYTRFGKVVAGMDVVDRIQVGDKVLSTSWY